MPKKLFTSANAREMQRRSAEAYQRNKPHREARKRSTQLAELSDGYLAESARIVREHIDHIDAITRHTADASELDRLASARLKYVEQEFLLSGRPKPGQYRPHAPPSRRVHAPAIGDGPVITATGIDAPPAD